MARLIDANKLLTILKERTTDEWNSKVAPMSWAYAYTDFADMIDTQPTVDAVPVVRCKDCKHMADNPAWPWCSKWREINSAGFDGFCNFGERKDDV